MRTALLSAIVLCTAVFLALPARSLAFHEGGVGYCDGCHALHGSTSSEPDAGSALLNAMDPSSVCLGCHAAFDNPYTIFNETSPSLTAGGDFSWLIDQETEAGRGRGHNVVAAAFGLSADDRNATAPGGSYPASELQCISCHDPHGKIAGDTNPAAISGTGSYGDAPQEGSILGNFRLLGGLGYTGSDQAAAFVAAAPVAVAPPIGSGPESDSNHTAYGRGMSEWCANCHADMLPVAGQGQVKHPAGDTVKLTVEMVGRYNSYVTTGDITGTRSNAYTALVPFELGTDDMRLLDPQSTSGPDENGQANVMCLTCHRAHASAFENSGRWDFSATFLVASYPQGAYYGRSMGDAFGPYQRSLCAKCHPFD